jgi:hypothetical protein
VHEYSCRGQELKNPLRIRRKDKLRRVNVFFICTASSKLRSSQRRKTKVEAFGRLKFFQVLEESAAFREEHSSHQIGDRNLDRWKVFTSRKEAQEECTRRMDLTVRI